MVQPEISHNNNDDDYDWYFGSSCLLDGAAPLYRGASAGHVTTGTCPDAKATCCRPLPPRRQNSAPAGATGVVPGVTEPCQYYYTHTLTHPYNGLLSGTTRVSRYQEGKTNLDFTEARDSEWHWHQLGCMQVCISLQTDNYASTPPLSFFTGRILFLPPPTNSIKALLYKS